MLLRQREGVCREQSFQAFLLLSQVSFMYYFQYMIGLRPDVTITLFCQEVDVTPQNCDFPEELVVDGGIKTLGLHLRATYREHSAAHFRLHLF